MLADADEVLARLVHLPDDGGFIEEQQREGEALDLLGRGRGGDVALGAAHAALRRRNGS